jgi:hypothetical protein
MVNVEHYSTDSFHFLSRYMLLMYHSAQVLLSCPSEQVVWSAMPDLDWLSSPAFLVAQEHAIRATALLAQLVESGTKITQLSAPVG